MWGGVLGRGVKVYFSLVFSLWTVVFTKSGQVLQVFTKVTFDALVQSIIHAMHRMWYLFNAFMTSRFGKVLVRMQTRL